MLRCFTVSKVWALALFLLPSFAFGGPLLNIGTLSFDPVTATAATFDISNFTGANDLPPDFNVATAVTLSNLSLTLDFVGGGSEMLTSANFMSDGANGFLGTFNLDTTKFSINQAALSGMFDTTRVMLADGTSASMDASFLTLLSDPNGLAIGASTTIDATLTPEPISFALAGMGVAVLAVARRRSK